MPLTNAQRLTRLLFKIAENDAATFDQRLEASRQLTDIMSGKPVKAGKSKKPVSSLLGSR